MFRIGVYLTAVILIVIFGQIILAAPPYFTNCPEETFEGYSASYTFETSEDPGNLPYHFNLIGPGSLTEINEYSFGWIFIADPTVFGHIVPAVFTVAGSENPDLLDSCATEIVVPYDQCGDANNNGIYNILDITFLIAFLYLGGPGPINDYFADVNCDGRIDILDVTGILMYIYQIEGWWPLNCCNIRDDFPITVGTWWQYQRYLENQEIYDTVMVSVIDWNTLEYLYADSADTVVAEFTSPDDLKIPGDRGLYTYYDFLLNIGKTWYQAVGDPWGYTYEDVVMGIETVSVPAGEFTDVFKIQRVSMIYFGKAQPFFGRNEWFKRGIGMIKMQMDVLGDHPEYPEGTWELIDYHIE